MVDINGRESLIESQENYQQFLTGILVNCVHNKATNICQAVIYIY